MGYYQANFPTNTLTWEENCWSDYGNVMGNGQTNNCAKVACKPNQGCVNIPYTDPDWATTPFVGCNAIIDCQAQYPNGCNPVDYYDCTQATGYQCDVVNYSTPHTSLGSCQTQHPNGCDPVEEWDCNEDTGYQCGQTPGGLHGSSAACLAAYPDGCAPDAYSCNETTCTCYVDPAGSMTLASCQAALLNPASDCYCNREDKYECVKYWSPKHGREICECVSDPNGQFTTDNQCQAALLDPNNRCYCGSRTGAWECDPATGQCNDTGSGPHPDKASCEATIDDHFNFGQGCDCQCQGCNGINNAGCAPPSCTGALNSPIPNDDPSLGAIGSILDLSQLLTTAFKERMAPCVPHTNSPGVAHDCKFWKFISEVKMPQTKMNYVLNNPTGGYAGTSQFPNSSQTAHPRWQRKIEAKVAYLRCLRQQCCMNTQWLDTAYAGGYTHTLTAANDAGQSYGAGWWTDAAGVWQPPL